MYYDLHIHSALSPCSDDDMTPNNIINMALIKGLDMIAICDHNSSYALSSFKKVADKHQIKLIYGVEIQTIEEVHVLAYFKNIDDIASFQIWLNSKFNHIKNDINYFGHQIITDEYDQVIDEFEDLLLISLNAEINEVQENIKLNKGIMVLAHVLDRQNSITHQLGFIPQNLKFDGIEIKNESEKEKVLKMHPWIKHTFWFINSDAHRLVDISEANNELDENDFYRLWGD